MVYYSFDSLTSYLPVLLWAVEIVPVYVVAYCSDSVICGAELHTCPDRYFYVCVVRCGYSPAFGLSL